MELKEHQIAVVEELLDSDGWALIKEMVVERIELRQLQIAAGRCDSYEDYLASCKAIRELEYLLNEPRRLLTTATMRPGVVRR